ncbi:MAG: DUF4301 family protein [Thermodesulfobacteriota bacterium]
MSPKIQISEEIISQLNQKGINEEIALSQIETFKNGIPYTELLRPCTVGDGIENIDDSVEKYIQIYDQESVNKNVIKFVPASGAASRMFKELLSISIRDNVNKNDLINDNTKESNIFLKFIDNIEKFAFLDDLIASLSGDGLDLETLLNEGNYKEIAQYTLGAKGLNYSNLPKGIIEFHKYENGARTAFEEHLVEAKVYSKAGDGTCRVHFTVSPEHMDRVKTLINGKSGLYKDDNEQFDISYSIQKPSTDTLAVDMNNQPFLDNDGRLVLRPGGHGALIENLNDLDCDIAFIKNIDNVVPDRLKEITYSYKKALGGYLLDIQAKIFEYLKRLDGETSSDQLLEEIDAFMQNQLKIQLPQGSSGWPNQRRKDFAFSKLNRPLRVCGVVKNVGEPGGGPFWITSRGQVSRQIVESAQVNLESLEQKAIWESSTHFNPVDLICGLKDYNGTSFDLRKYVDTDMGFISYKSKDGRELKALELPGLWNGAMADWISIFIEVPLITFNPVKGVLDLLRDEHQNSE